MRLDGLRERSDRGGRQIVEAEQIAEAGQDALGISSQADSVPVRLEIDPTAGPAGGERRKGPLYPRERGPATTKSAVG